MMNQILIDESKKEDERNKTKLTVYNLSKTYFKKFRPNFEQGILVECFIPIIFYYIIGTFSEDWVPLENHIFAYLVIFCCYFRFTNAVENAWFFWITFIAYFAWQVLIGYKSNWYHLIHFVFLVLPIELIPNYFEGQFTVAELFIFLTLNA